jgi:hypothetical protein
VKKLRDVTGKNVEEIANKMVALLNEYRLFLDVEIIFDREADFLYRQKGQTKLDNSVIEEFLPHLERVLNFHDDPAVQLAWQGSRIPAMSRTRNGTLSRRI